MSSGPVGDPSFDKDKRYRRLIRIISITGLVVLATTLATELYFGTRPVTVLFGFFAAVILLGYLFLVESGRITIARYLMPASSWLVVNSLFFFLPSVHPLLFITINSVILLLTGALLDHFGVLVVSFLTILLSAGISLAEINGLISIFTNPGENWLSAGPLFALITLLSYYTFRDRHMAMQEAVKRAEETETLLQASHAAISSLDMQETIERILVQLEHVVPYHSASAQILTNGALEIVGGRGWDESAQVIGIQFPVPGDNPNTVVIETRQPYILDNAPEAFEAFRQPPHDHIHSVLGVPLIIGDELIGMLSVDHRQASFYDDSHARLVQAFADQVAIAIQNARHFQAEQRRRQLAAMQQDITQITSSSLELDEVLQRVSSLTCQAVDADISIIFSQPHHDDAKQSTELHVCNDGTGEEVVTEVRERLLPLLRQDVLSQLTPQYGAAIVNLALTNLTGEAAESLRHWFSQRQGLIVPLIAAGHSTGAMLLLRLSPDPPFDDATIEMAETIALSVATSIENASLYQQMEHMAITDSLTDLYNRRGLIQLGEREIERARRFDRPFSTLMLDLDHFKKLNDSYGHMAGDEVLRQLADLLTQLVRNIDVVARYGGEEFTILLPECSHDCAHMVAERLRLAVANTPFKTSAGDLNITISVGVASGSNLPLEMERMLNAADQALYAAKEAGRNQSWSWHPPGPRPANP